VKKSAVRSEKVAAERKGEQQEEECLSLRRRDAEVDEKRRMFLVKDVKGVVRLSGIQESFTEASRFI
jgi:hypothetical protein